MPVATTIASIPVVEDGGNPFKLSQADWAVSTIVMYPFPTDEERTKIAAFVARVRACGSDPRQFGLTTLPDRGFVSFWVPAATWFADPQSDLIIGEFAAALLWRVIGRPGKPAYTVGTRPPLCPREWVGTPRTPARVPSRPLLLSARRAVRVRARELGVQVAVSEPVEISTEQLVDDIHVLIRAIARAARLKGEASWPSPTA